MELHRCDAAWCGDLRRPLDPSGGVAGSLDVHVEFYPHSDPGPAKGTLVATEGGPGYPATLSRDDYLDLFGPLMSSRDVVLMDNRGTGRSAALDCRELQSADRWTVEGVGACGASLGTRAPFYGTAYAADDLAAVLAALGAGPIDLYGDSYGTYFVQVFALRHPMQLRSVILDGAYPLDGTDYAWYPTYAPAMRDKFDIACRRSPACAALGGSSLDHIQPALDAMRAQPTDGTGSDVDGGEHRVRADPPGLAIVMFGGAPAGTTVRDTDAAARAYVAGDRAPLERLLAETAAAVDSRDPTADPRRWSAGLAAAVMCEDPPQIVNMHLPPELRARDRDRVLAERRKSHPATYAPFTVDEYRAMPLDYSFLDLCVAWPAYAPGVGARPAEAAQRYPDVPALVISGELDAITTPADGAAVARAFPHGVQIRIANSFHVNALPRARSACAAGLVRRFIRTLSAGDASCAAAVPPVRLVPRFARRTAELDPATALPGNAAGDAALRVVHAAVLTVGDVLARVNANSSGHGVGLRGGAFRVLPGLGLHARLDRVRFTADLSVSGEVSEPRRAGPAHANLQIDWAPPSSGAAAVDGAPVPGTQRGRLSIDWREGAGLPTAQIAGRIGAARVSAHCPAP